MDLSKKRQLGVAAVVTVALVGAGAALASSKLKGHTGTRDSGAAGFAARGAGSMGFRAGYGAPRNGFRGHGGPSDDLAAATTYLGISTSTLQADLQSGKTLAQVAASISGKSADDLIATLVAHEKAELASAVSAGRPTQAQADTFAANIQQRVTNVVNGMFRGHGHGGPGGMAPPGRI